MSGKPKNTLRVVDHIPDVVLNAMSGETYEDDGFRLDPIIAKYLDSLNGKPSTRKSGIYSPSQLGGCLRALYYNRMGVERREYIPAGMRMIFSVGHSVEASFDDVLEGASELGLFAELGLVLRKDIDLQFTPYHLAGELDYLLEHIDENGDKRIIDLKTISKTRFESLRQPQVFAGGVVSPKDMGKYVMQLHCYMAAVGAKYGTLYYICKDNGQRFEASFVFNRHMWALIESRIQKVEEHAEVESPPEREVDKFSCEICSWAYECQPPGIKIMANKAQVTS